MHVVTAVPLHHKFVKHGRYTSHKKIIKNVEVLKKVTAMCGAVERETAVLVCFSGLECCSE